MKKIRRKNLIKEIKYLANLPGDKKSHNYFTKSQLLHLKIYLSETLANVKETKD